MISAAVWLMGESVPWNLPFTRLSNKTPPDLLGLAEAPITAIERGATSGVISRIRTVPGSPDWCCNPGTALFRCTDSPTRIFVGATHCVALHPQHRMRRQVGEPMPRPYGKRRQPVPPRRWGGFETRPYNQRRPPEQPRIGILATLKERHCSTRRTTLPNCLPASR